MDYYESAEGLTITRKRALQEVRSHYAEIELFLHEIGDKKEYSAQAVLDWLGY